MKKEIGFDAFRILPPRPDVCQVCAANHDPDWPHNRDSLYYQMTFYQKHKRFPTWADAMAHCPEELQAAWRENLAARGIPEEELTAQ